MDSIPLDGGQLISVLCFLTLDYTAYMLFDITATQPFLLHLWKAINPEEVRNQKPCITLLKPSTIFSTSNGRELTRCYREQAVI